MKRDYERVVWSSVFEVETAELGLEDPEFSDPEPSFSRNSAGPSKFQFSLLIEIKKRGFYFLFAIKTSHKLQYTFIDTRKRAHDFFLFFKRSVYASDTGL